jgi:hypothetical protein
MSEKLHFSHNWTMTNKALFWNSVACCSVVALAMATVFWPVIFVPGMWEGYTCWEDRDAE